MPSAKKLLKHGFTIETIMTPRAELLTWERGADLAYVLDTPGKRNCSSSRRQKQR